MAMVAQPVVPDGERATFEPTSPSLEDLITWANEAVSCLAARVAELGKHNASAGPLAIAALAPMDRLVTALGLARTGLIGIAAHHARSVDLGGERTFTAWRARTSREGHTAAQAQVNLAHALEDVPGLSAAVQTGQITLTHAGILADGLQRAEDPVRERLTHEAANLIETARRVPPQQLRRELDARRTAIEAEQADHTYAAVRAARYVRTRARNGGVSVEGFLDPIAGATLREALDALTPTPAAADERTPDQRRADALTLLADRTLNIGATKTGAQIRPHLSVLIREDTWLLLMHRRRIAAEGCATPGQGSATPGQGCAMPGQATRQAHVESGLAIEPPLAQLLDGTLLPFAALDVLACDAFVQRVVLDTTGAPIDLGRTERTYIKDARRAILIRDRHCQWPGCALRATWCEVHHLTWWSKTGPTDQVNGITLCKNHHHTVHDRGVRITPTFGGFTFTHDDGQPLGESTRLHDTMLVPRPPPPSTQPKSPGPPSTTTPDQQCGDRTSGPEDDVGRPHGDVARPDQRDSRRRSDPLDSDPTHAELRDEFDPADSGLPDDCPALLW